MPPVKPLASLPFLLGLAAPALSQDLPPDWDLARDDRRQIVVASISYDNGIGIAARCMRGSFELLLLGLPEARGRDPVRNLQVAFQDEDFRDYSWAVSESRTTVFSDLPAPFARRLREGGRLQIRVPAERDAQARRYVLELPESPAAVEAALNACGRQLQDSRDRDMDGVVAESLAAYKLVWVEQPRPRYPIDAQLEWASVSLTCVVLDEQGRIGDCIIESEHPGGFDFGKQAVRGAMRGRVGLTEDSPPGAPFVGRRVTFRVQFRLA